MTGKRPESVRGTSRRKSSKPRRQVETGTSRSARTASAHRGSVQRQPLNVSALFGVPLKRSESALRITSFSSFVAADTRESHTPTIGEILKRSLSRRHSSSSSASTPSPISSKDQPPKFVDLLEGSLANVPAETAKRRDLPVKLSRRLSQTSSVSSTSSSPSRSPAVPVLSLSCQEQPKGSTPPASQRQRTPDHSKGRDRGLPRTSSEARPIQTSVVDPSETANMYTRAKSIPYPIQGSKVPEASYYGRIPPTYHRYYEMLCQRELDSKVEHDYLLRHSSMSAQLRTLGLSWILDVCDEAQLRIKTLFGAFAYFDAYCSVAKEVVKSSNLQLICCACLRIATKVYDTRMLASSLLEGITYGRCSATDITLQELKIGQALGWQLMVPCPFTWAELFVAVAEDNQLDSESATSWLIRTAVLLETSMLDMQCLRFSCAALGAAAVALTSPRPALDIVRVSGIGKDELLLCTKWMYDFAACAGRAHRLPELETSKEALTIVRRIISLKDFTRVRDGRSGGLLTTETRVAWSSATGSLLDEEQQQIHERGLPLNSHDHESMVSPRSVASTPRSQSSAPSTPCAPSVLRGFPSASPRVSTALRPGYQIDDHDLAGSADLNDDGCLVFDTIEEGPERQPVAERGGDETFDHDNIDHNDDDDDDDDEWEEKRMPSEGQHEGGDGGDGEGHQPFLGKGKRPAHSQQKTQLASDASSNADGLPLRKRAKDASS